MFIRTQEEALEALAGILDLPERRDQIVLTTVRIMDCLDPEPRRFMADSLALLVEGGLEALRRERREAQEGLPLVVVDPEEDRKYETVASALDARRLSGVILQVFPDLLPPSEAWKVARALLRDEEAVRTPVARAIRCRGESAERRKAQEELASLIEAHAPPWAPRTAELRGACRDILEASGVADPEGEGAILFDVLATAEGWAEMVLWLMEEDPPGAILEVLRIHDLLEAVRNAQEAAEIQGLCQTA